MRFDGFTDHIPTKLEPVRLVGLGVDGTVGSRVCSIEVAKCPWVMSGLLPVVTVGVPRACAGFAGEERVGELDDAVQDGVELLR